MKFLVDNAISHVLAELLKNLNHDALHVRDIDIANASDQRIFNRAYHEERVIISADTDFSLLLSNWPILIHLLFFSEKVLNVTRFNK